MLDNLFRLAVPKDTVFHYYQDNMCEKSLRNRRECQYSLGALAGIITQGLRMVPDKLFLSMYRPFNRVKKTSSDGIVRTTVVERKREKLL
jgi:hypothetical protein